MSCDYFQADLDVFVTLSVIKAKLLDKLPAISHNTKKAPGALLLRVDKGSQGLLAALRLCWWLLPSRAGTVFLDAKEKCLLTICYSHFQSFS